MRLEEPPKRKRAARKKTGKAAAVSMRRQPLAMASSTALLVWRKMTGKAPIKLNGKTVLSVVVGVLGALVLGVGMCMVMVFEQMTLGVVVGLAGIVILLCLIPLVKGIHD